MSPEEHYDSSVAPDDETVPVPTSGGGNVHRPSDEEPPALHQLPNRFQPGDIVARRFSIVRYLGSGGMGEVYEAEDRFLQGTHIALKAILPHIADEPALQQRFEREVLLAREVIHP